MEQATSPAPESAPKPRRAGARGGRRVWVRRAVLASVGGAVVVAIVVAWLPKPVPVDAVAARRGPMKVTVDEDGRTRVREKYVVAAPLAGTLARIELHPGDTMKAEQVIARIVPMSPPLLDARSRAEAEARVLAAEAAKKQAEVNVTSARLARDFASDEAKRLETLESKGAASSQGLDRARLNARSEAEALAAAEFGAQVAAHQLTQSQVALTHVRGPAPGKGEYLELSSPTGGRVLRVLQESAGPVQAGAQLLEIGDPTRLEVVVDVLTADAVQIEPGARVTIDHWGGDWPLAAHVRKVEPSAFTRVSALGVEEQRVNVVIDLDEPLERRASLGDGYRVDAHIVVWETPSALVVPAGAVFRHGEGWAVYRIEGGRARVSAVELGKRNGVEVQIDKGLAERDQVVLHPSDRITDGVKVEVR